MISRFNYDTLLFLVISITIGINDWLIRCISCFSILTASTQSYPGIWKVRISSDDATFLTYQNRPPVFDASEPFLGIKQTPLETNKEGDIRTTNLMYNDDIPETKFDNNNQLDSSSSDSNIIKREILIKINQDGTFRQCDEGYTEGCWISGRWYATPDVANANITFLFALNRQYYGPRYDTVLVGTIQSDDAINNPQRTSNIYITGTVCTGKFLYIKSHPLFFDLNQSFANSTTNGRFSMKRLLSINAIVSDSNTSHNLNPTLSSQFD